MLETCSLSLHWTALKQSIFLSHFRPKLQIDIYFILNTYKKYVLVRPQRTDLNARKSRECSRIRPARRENRVSLLRQELICIIDTQSLSSLLDILARQEGHRRLRLTSLWLWPNARSATCVNRAMDRMGTSGDVRQYLPRAVPPPPLLARAVRRASSPSTCARRAANGASWQTTRRNVFFAILCFDEIIAPRSHTCILSPRITSDDKIL